MPRDIKTWRKHHGLTQAEAAEIVGVHPNSWSSWENGATAPNWLENAIAGAELKGLAL